MVVPICASLMVTWKPRMATLLDQSSRPYASPSWTDTPGRLSTTDVTAVMFDCCSIIGSATTLVAKMRGSSATTVTDSSSRVICRTTGTVSVARARTKTGISAVSNPGNTAVTT